MAAKRDQDFFWEGVDRGELLAQRCEACGTLRHPPMPTCAACRSLAWAPERLSGRGTLHSWVVSRPPGDREAKGQLVVLVDLAEGLRMVSNLVDADTAAVGAPVELCFGEVNGRRLPLFRKVGGEQP